MSDKIKLVVFKGHTLGYISPQLPNYVQHLKCSVLKGHSSGDPNSDCGSTFIGHYDKNQIKLASKEDFEDFNVHFGSFGNKDEYEFAES